MHTLGASGAEEPRCTTGALLQCERALLDCAARRRGTAVAALPQPLLERALAACRPALNEDQAAAVRAIAMSGNGVDAVQALAGTGKDDDDARAPMPTAPPGTR